MSLTDPITPYSRTIMTTVLQQSFGEILLYQTEDGRTRIECRFQDKTLWLSQAMIADLFQNGRPHDQRAPAGTLYEEAELDPAATIRKFRIVRREGTREVAREIEHYSLDAILAVGYRVRSLRGTQFRRWATERLRRYTRKAGSQLEAGMAGVAGRSVINRQS